MNFCWVGAPEPLGVTLTPKGINVAVVSGHATAIEFCLFDGDAERRFRLPARSGDLFHGHIDGIREGARYGLRAHGPFSPDDGHRFNPAKLLLDPYALAIDRPLRLHPSMFTHGTHDRRFDDTDSAPHMAKAIVMHPVPAAPGTAITSWARTVIYEMHVRGFTQRHPDIPPELRGTFAGLAHPAAIAHLVSLGITAVEIMPPAAWVEERHLAALGLENYWGYNPVGWMAPDPRLAPGGWAEVRHAIATLAAAGIETIIDVVFNHSGEGDALGPTLSLRGLDNATYYRLADGRYIDDSGCGNTMALDRPAPLRLAMDSLRAWAVLGGAHGFRFDLASTMGRRVDGFDPHAPVLAAISQDPVLRDLKLIAEPWDIGPGGYQLGQFPLAWAEWNDRYRDDVRRFWRGDPGRLGDLATRLAGSADIFAHRRRPHHSVNFITAHDGFTLTDLVSFQDKHNHANGEDNRDGTGSNWSWNNGCEGATDNTAILAARQSDQKALLATLLLSRGTPMLCMGSEFGQSQGGNNNAYCQDNAIAWLDWEKADPDLLAWTQRLIQIRGMHPALHDDRFLTGETSDSVHLPEMLWLDATGAPMTDAAWHSGPGDVLGMVLTVTGSRVAVLLNRGRSPATLSLPDAADGQVWRDLTGTQPDTDTITVPPRGVRVLAEAAGPVGSKRARVTDPALLERLAQAAGIAPDWWEVDGTHHRVSPDTLRALLAAMRLPAGTSGEARDTLAGLAETIDRRALPHALVRRVGEPLNFCLTLDNGLCRRPLWLVITSEIGEVRRHRVHADEGVLSHIQAADGRLVQSWRVTLPDLPVGRHRVHRDDAADSPCGVTVAPHAGYLPDSIRNEGRRFGIAAQLYTLRRAADQGIGDFSTLRELAIATRRAGGAALGLNPLHMMFPTDRSRASPYQPSDRRFLDPIYLDVSAFGPVPDAAALRALADVDYHAVWRLKLALLEQQFERQFAGAPQAGLDHFIATGGDDLKRFAIFQTAAEEFAGQPWREWPDGLRDATHPAVQRFGARHAGRVRFHQYLQYLCDQQLANAAGQLEIGFIRDLAVGCAPDGAEAWDCADRLGEGASVGAPPDPFSATGQIWGLPPPNPLRMAEDGYSGFARLLAANLRHAGGLRIDHVMGLARLFWVPSGGSGADGAYVNYPLADLMGQVALESVRAQALIIGEDLGTVPDGLREAMASNNMLRTRVLLLEREGPRFKPATAYPTRAVASVSSHDLPPFAGWLEGADIAERAQLGLGSGGTAERDTAERDTEIRHLAERTGIMADGADPTVAAHAFIAGTQSCLTLVQADDLAGETRAVNLPGTDTERPNWRRKLAEPVATLLATPRATAILRAAAISRATAENRSTTEPGLAPASAKV